MTPLHARLAGCALGASLFIGIGVAPSAAQQPQSPAAPQTPQAPTSRQAPQPGAPQAEREVRIPADRGAIVLGYGQGTEAGDTRERLRATLRRYPPSVGQVLRLDPSLLTQPAYLAPYPELAAFLAQHPEVVRSPAFFLGGVGLPNFGDFEPRNQAISMWQDVLMGSLVLFGFVAFFGAVTLVARSVIDHRRWLRLSKVQVDAHTKLLDRFSSHEDLLAYIQTPAGRRFLEAAPISVDLGSRAVGAPIGRILWSVQAGLVLGLGGLGLQFVSRRVIEDVGQGLYVIGIVGFSLGVGFILSSVVAYVLSRRLGLLEPGTTRPAMESTGPSNLP